MQEALAREQLQAKLLKQRQRAEQGVAEERELQQRKRKQWRWDRHEPLERQELCSL